MDRDIEDIDKLIKGEEEEEEQNKDLLLKLLRFRHEIKLNKMKLLQDVELPIKVKKLKRERKMRTLKLVPVGELTNEETETT